MLTRKIYNQTRARLKMPISMLKMLKVLRQYIYSTKESLILDKALDLEANNEIVEQFKKHTQYILS